MPVLAGLMVILVLCSACSSFDVINGVTRASSYTAERDIGYATHERGGFDVYLPVVRQPDAPVLVFFYGGGWREGSKDDYEFVASELTAAGIVVVVPDYRLYPQVQFPVFVEDAADAWRGIRAHLASLGLDRNRWYVGGHSAGAHIAALLALDQRYLNDQHATIAGFIGLSGPYDFLPLEDSYLADLFPAEIRDDSQPIRFAGPHAPKTLLIHGDDDDTVDIGNSERLYRALDEAGSQVALKTYKGVGHARVVAALAGPLSPFAPTARDIIAFIKTAEAAAQTPDAG